MAKEYDTKNALVRFTARVSDLAAIPSREVHLEPGQAYIVSTDGKSLTVEEYQKPTPERKAQLTDNKAATSTASESPSVGAREPVGRGRTNAT